MATDDPTTPAMEPENDMDAAEEEWRPQWAGQLWPAAALIREARLRSFLTQTQMADRLGVSQSLISRWECGKTVPNFDSVLRAIGAANFRIEIELVPMRWSTPLPGPAPVRIKPIAMLHARQSPEHMMRMLKQRRKAERLRKLGLEPRVVGPHV